MVVVTVALQGWPIGGQMLFAFGSLILLVWWQERRRARKALSKLDTVEDDKQRGHPLNTAPRHFDEQNISKLPVSAENQSTTPSQSPKPPKQDYAAIVGASQSAAPALSAIAKRYENARPTARKPQTNSRKIGWIPSAETVTVAGRDIGGMVYVGTPPLLNNHGYRDKCRAFIDPTLSVARTGGDRAGERPYGYIL